MNQMIHAWRRSRGHADIWHSEWGISSSPVHFLSNTFSFSTTTSSSLPLQSLIFNLLIWPPLTLVALSFFLPLIHHPSIMNTSEKEVESWGKSRVDELNRRCSEEGGVSWTSGCSPQLSARLLFDLKEIRKLEDPQPVGSNSHYKKKPPAFCFMNYWDIGLQLLKYTGGWSVSHFGFHILSTLWIFLSFSPLTFYFLHAPPFPFRFSLLRQRECKSEHKQRQKIKREQQRKTVCYSDHKRLFLLYSKKFVYH